MALFASGAPVRAMQLGTMRGGTFSATTNAMTSAVTGAQQSATLAQQSMTALRQAVQAVQQSMQQAQAQARAVAQQTPSGVPNGLVPGGLQVAPGAIPGSSLWQNANLPSETVSNGETNVTVQQTAPQAILTWQTFNVGQNTTLNFNQQGNTNWVALNRIIDPTQRPSQILGSITASGQVYVINPNGIVFGGASQVNVGTLVASTADFNPAAVAGTYSSQADASDADFLTNGIYSTQTGGTYNPSFTNAGGTITVEPGAEISTPMPSSVTSGGGFVLLMGTQVSNQGTIETPDGQTELAAGDNFLIRPGYSTTGNSWSTTRGNEIAVELDQQGSSLIGGSGYVSNTGTIEADTGDITLAGETVVQGGVAYSTTSVNVRGTIHLLSSASDPQSSVTLTPGSLTIIDPDTSGATALNTQRAALIADSATQDTNRFNDASIQPGGQFDDLSTLADLEDESRIEITSGGAVEFQNGSISTASGGQIAVSAINRVQVDTGALLDVAGDEAILPMSANDIAVSVQGNELRDDPNNRDTGILFDDTVYVDDRYLTYVPAGTGGDSSDRYYTAGGVFEVSGWLNTTPHTIDEWLASGGSITLATGTNGAVVAQPGSTFNISGGDIQYQSGTIQQTYLIGPEGDLYNANFAPADLTYSGIYEGFVDAHPHWGVTDYFGSPFRPSEIYQQGYTVGRDAGSLILSTPTALFDGTIEAGITDGQDQDTPRPATVTDPYLLTQTTVPLQGSIALGQYNSLGLVKGYDTDVTFGTASDASSTNDAGAITGSAPLPTSAANTADFDANELSNENLGGISVVTAGSITVNAPLSFAPGAQIKLIAANTDIAANITAPSGNITISNLFQQAGTTALPTALVDSNGLAQVTLEPGVSIDTEGLWTNAALDPADVYGVGFVNGGNVSIDTTQGITLASGSLINTSSGAAILSNGSTKGGAGGNITLIADDPTAGGGGTAPLILDGMLSAYGVTKGGALTLQTGQSVTISDEPILTNGILSAGQAAPVPVVLSAAVTIPAGGAAPFAVPQTFATDTAGQSLSASVTPTFQDNGGQGLLVSANSNGWTVPSTLTVFDNNGNQYNPGQVVPPGTLLVSGSGTLPFGYVVPASVFPNGIAINPVTLNVAQGSVLMQPVTLAAGTAAPIGAMFAQNVTIAPLLDLSPATFSSGFSSYTITGEGGVTVAPGTQVNVVEPVYQLTSASYAVPTGSDPSAALQVWTPPLYLANSATATLTKRAGASLSLNGAGESGLDGPVTIGASSLLAVDPGQSITISGNGQITVDGTLRAPGGAIAITGIDAAPASLAAGQSIWIGADAVLDVSAQAVTALDSYGRPYGVVPAGGSIVLGQAGDVISGGNGIINSTSDFIVARPGAVLDASGASALIDPNAGAGSSYLLTNGGADRPVLVTSNGGSISLSSYSGIYMDGTMQAAAGGPGAAGGTLNVTLETEGDWASYDPTDPTFVPRIITISQAPLAPQLPADLQPGISDPSLQYGQAQFSADTLMAGGFGSLSFTGRDAILFNGNVNLTAGQSIAFHEGAIADVSASGQVTIAAPYVLLDGFTGINTNVISVYPSLWGSNDWQPSTQQSAGAFNVNADLIDISNEVVFGIDSPALTTSPGSRNAIGSATAYDYTGFASVDLTSQGDIRFLGGVNSPGQGPFSSDLGAALITSGDLTFTAAQLYPVMSSSIANGVVHPTFASVIAGAQGSGAMDPDSVITINRISDVDPAVPDSITGEIAFSAGTINQGGVVRAPFGSIEFLATNAINLLPESITSSSMNGLTMLVGGTVDGITWTYDGGAFNGDGDANFGGNAIFSGNNVTLNSPSFNVAAGAVIDVSGGGDIAGSGFIQGEGGSVNILTTPLVNANPANNYSAAGDQVYAIIPGYQSNYAPVDPAAGAASGIGQQITIPSGVPGLPAGTYTLLPANYALLPGGYRVELGGVVARPVQGAVAASDGAYLIEGYQSVANAGVRNALPTELIVMPGSGVRDNSDFDETNYSNYEIQLAASVENVRPALPMDGGTLVFEFNGTPSAGQSALTFNGTALFAPGTDAQSGVTGQPGQADIYPEGANVEVYAGAPTPGFNGVSLNVDDLNNIAAPSLTIGGGPNNSGSTGVVIDSGVVLKAAQVLLVSGLGGTITLQPDAEIDTIGMGAVPVPLSGNNLVTAVNDAILAVSNGDVTLNYLGNPISTIDVEAGAQLYSEGSIGFAAGGSVTIADSAVFGTTNLGFSAADINIGDQGAMATANVPAGFNLTQAKLSTLLAGDPAVGAPPLQTLTLTASQSVNVFGTVDLDVVDPATGKADLNLVLNTPAIYGYGGASDIATLAVGTLAWSGVAGATPGPITTNGPGTGAGVLNIVANQIAFGFPSNVAPDAQTTYDRVIYGFSTVNLIAPEITSTNKNTLSVYQSVATVQGVSPSGAGVGGDLNLETSLLTGAAGSVMGFTAGGAITIAPPSGAAPALPGTGALGAEIELTTGGGINVGSTILLPSGLLTMTAAGDINLQPGSNLDLAGQATMLVDQTEYSWGGDVVLESTGGNIIQAAGSTINVSAVDNNAGLITAQAVGSGAGQVALNGTLEGSATSTPGVIANFNGGSIDLSAQTLASGNAANLSADFAALNTALDAGGFSYSRTFDLKQGDLTIGNEVVAHQVNVSVDNGSLTVNGTINASGITPGSINLAAQDDLTLNGTLDAHGTVLQVDSYGNPIAAENSGQIVLTAMQGTLTLSPGATIDLSVTDPRNLDAAGDQIVNYGQVILNAPRTGETSGDIQISAPGPLTLRGVGSITLNGFWAYSPTDPNGTVVQDNGSTTPVGSSTDTTTSISGIEEAISTTTTTTLTTIVTDNYPLTGAVTFTSTNVPNPNDAIGEQALVFSSGSYFDFPNSATVIAGEIIDNVNGAKYLPGKSIQYFYFNGPGTTFTAGTELMLPGVAAGTTLISVGSTPVLLNSVHQTTTQVLSTTTKSDPIGTSTGTTTTSVNNPDGSVTTTTAITTATFTNLPTVVTADPLNTPNGTTTTTILVQNGYGQVTTTAVTATGTNPDAGFLGLNQINTQSQAFMNAAATSGLLGKIGGLTAQGTAFNIQPGVEIKGAASSGGNLTVSGDLDFSGFRYSDPNGIGQQVNPNVYGSGEPGSVIFRASGNLTVEGSITDGFGMPPVSPDDNGWANGQPGFIYALAPMLPAGDLSWSMELVAGADLGAANPDVLQSEAQLDGGGNLILNDPHGGATVPGTSQPSESFSVIRTGTGSLSLLAGGDFDEESPFGIYTAGTDSAGIGPNGSDPYNLARGLNSDGSGTVLGSGNAAYDNAIEDQLAYYFTSDGALGEVLKGYQAYYPTGGGDLLVSVQGNLTAIASNNAVGDWLWTQGGAVAGQAAAWWINFGTYTPNSGVGAGDYPALTGFNGFGALGGGNVALNVGGNANGVTAAVGSTGRVLANGTLAETGGGNLIVNVGGAIGLDAGGNGSLFTDLRGDTVVDAGSIGAVAPAYGSAYGYASSGQGITDPRYIGPLVADSATVSGGITVDPGDGSVTISTRGDLVLADAANPGLASQPNTTPFTSGGASFSGGGDGWFSLWTNATAVNLFSAGGNLAPSTFQGQSEPGPGYIYIYPSSLNAVAASGSLYFPTRNFPLQQPVLELAPAPDGQLNLLAEGSIIGGSVAMSGADPSVIPTPFDPAFYYSQFDVSTRTTTTVTDVSPDTYGFGFGTGLLFAFGPDTPTTDLHADDPNPIRIYAATGDIVGFNFGEVLTFAPSTNPATPSITPSTWYVGAKAADIIAGGDIVIADQNPAGGNIAPGFILNDNPTDVSLISAGGNIIYSGMQVGGPGQLVVQAGDNYYAANQASLVSLGRVYNIIAQTNDTGGGITLLAGVGANGPDYAALANLYLNPLNAANPSAPIDGQPGKAIQTADALAQLNDLYSWVKVEAGYTGNESGALAFFNSLPASQRASYPSNPALFVWLKTQGYNGNQGDALAYFLGLPASEQSQFTYDAVLFAWLDQNYGYTGSEANAYGYFQTLPAVQQDVFLRQIYFDELNASGLDFNNASAEDYKSYVRGKQAIATLFPTTDADGNPITYAGDITMFGASGIHTDFGGDIETLTPGGQTTVGVEGTTPPGSAGIITQGAGDIDMYSLGSVNLGESRVMTTFGGGIVIWSATGNIDAGKGTKTTVVYQPPLRAYDKYGNVTLSPQVPSTGAGIATLNPIPQVPPGDINLVAPQGIVDAGEAGIRVSGTFNVAALEVVNTANISVQGAAVGIPTVVAPNIGALDSASSAAGAAVKSIETPAQNHATLQPSILIVEIEGYGGGDDSESPEPENSKKTASHNQRSDNQIQDPQNRIQVLGAGDISEGDALKLADERRRSAEH